MMNNVKTKKRLTQIIIACLCVCLTLTGGIYLLSDLTPEVSAATNISSISAWNNTVGTASSGSVLDITLTGDLAYTNNVDKNGVYTSAYLSAVPAGVTVNLNMNGHSIYWDTEGSGGEYWRIMSTSYPLSNSYWGVLTNRGNLNISGTGTIRMKKICYNQNNGSKMDNYGVKSCAIVNSGTNAVLTIGSGITVEDYTAMAHNRSGNGCYADQFVHSCAIYNDGTVNTSGKIYAGSFSANTAVTGTNSFHYAFSYGIYGGTVNTKGGTISSIARSGALDSSLTCKEGNHMCNYAIGVYSNSAKILGDTTITTESMDWMSTTSNNCWGSGMDISFSAGVMYSGTNYPLIGASVDINSTFVHAKDDTRAYIPGGNDLYYTVKSADNPSNCARRAYPVVGINATNHISYTVGSQPSEKNYSADGGYFGIGSTATSEYMDNDCNKYCNFNANMYYRAEEPYYDNATSTYTTSALSAYQKESGQNTNETKTAVFKNGAPGSNGAQFVVLYRYYKNNMSGEILNISHKYDSNIQKQAAYFSVGGNVNRTGVMLDSSSAITYTNGGSSKNEYYYKYEGVTFERVASNTFANRDINDKTKWTGGTTPLGSGGTTCSSSQTIIMYMNYSLKDPSNIRVAAADKDSTMAGNTTTTEFTATYTGSALIPNRDFKIGIIDVGSLINNTDDDLVVTNVYDVSGNGSQSGNNSTAVTYQYSQDGSTWTNGLPKNVGNYTIRVTVKADTTFAPEGTYNRNGKTADIKCTIVPANVTISGPSAKNGIYGDNLATLVPFSDYSVTGLGTDTLSGSWSFAQGKNTTDYLNAGSYNLEIVWTPTPGSQTAKNYNSAVYSVTLEVAQRNVTVYMGESYVGFGENSVTYTLEYINLAPCDRDMKVLWAGNSTGQIFVDGEWVDYSRTTPIGTYEAKLVTFGGVNDPNNHFTIGQNGQLEVGKKQIHYVAEATNRPYISGNNIVDVKLTYVTGATAEDAGTVVSTIYTTGTMNNANAGENKLVTINVNAVEGISDNYKLTIDNAPSLTVDIAKADPTGVSCVADPANIVYDSARTLSSIALTPVQESVAGSWSWAESAIVPSCDVSAYTAVFTPSDKNNYNSITQQVALAVEQKDVFVSVPGFSIVYGSPIPALAGSVTYDGFTGSDTINTIETTGEVTPNTNYNRGSNVGTYNITVGCALASVNYKFTGIDTTLTVTKKDLTITAKNDTIEYGDSVPVYDLTVVTATGLISGDTLQKIAVDPKVTTNYIQGSGAGTYDINVTGYASNNYNITFVPGKLTVTKAVLTVAPTAQTIRFGQSTPKYQADKLYAITGFKLNDSADLIEINGLPSFATIYQSGRGAGEYPVEVTIAEMSSDNYTFRSAEGTLTVEKATPEVVAAASASVVHSEPYSTAVFGEGAEVVNPYRSDLTVDGSFALANPDTTAEYSGSMILVDAIFTPNDDSNYTTVTVKVWLNILTKQISGAPDIIGSPMSGSQLTVDVSSMDPSDATKFSFQWYRDGALLSGKTDIAYDVGDNDIGGKLTVVVMAIDGTGYVGSAESTPTSKVIAYIEPASVAQISATLPENCVYDGQAHAAAVVAVSGLDEYKLGAITVKYNGSVTAPKNAGTYTVTVDIDAPKLPEGSDNYAEGAYGPASGLRVGTFTIAKTPYYVSVNASSKEYDGTRNATAFVETDGVVYGDDVTLRSGYTFAFTNANAGTDKTVVVSGLALVGTSASNYYISTTNGTADITPKTLEARAVGVTKVYDGSVAVDVKFTNITGYADADSAATVYFLSGTASAISPNAGTQYLSDINYVLGGRSAGNYVVHVANADNAVVEITRATPKVTAPVITGLVYDSSRTLQNIDLTPYEVTGAGGGYWAFDDLSIVPTVSEKRYAATYYAPDSNYTNVQTEITIEITPAHVVLRPENATVQYGRAIPTFKVIATGLTGLDTLGDVSGNAPLFTTEYHPGMPVGRYDVHITPRYDDDNYTFSVDDGSLMVIPATLTVQASSVNKVYDGNADITVNFTIVSGRYSNDDVALNTTTTVGTAATANSGQTIVTYTAPYLTGSTAGNYELLLSQASGILDVYIDKADVAGVIFPTEGAVEFGYNLTNVKFATNGAGDGKFEYENAKTTVPEALGVYTNYKVVFIPTDSRNYNSQSAYVTLTVNKCKLNYAVGISGVSQEGEKLTAVTAGMPSLANDYIKYQWYRMSAEKTEAINGATSSVYVATSDDVGYTLVVFTYFEDSDPYVLSDSSDAVEIDEGSGVFGIYCQTENPIKEIAMTFWQRLLNWIRKIIAAITGLMQGIGK